MSEPADHGGAPPPPPGPTSSAGEEFFTGTLQHANRMVNAAAAVRLHLMLAGLEAMVLEEEALTGARLRPDDPVVKGRPHPARHPAGPLPLAVCSTPGPR